MAVWEQLEVSKPHIAYACVGVFSSVFSLVSLFVKEKLYIGESTLAGIFGLIVGPHCLNWFNPLSWGNSDAITLEITRIVLCLQIFAVAVELPRKYMKKHWLSVTMLLIPVMTAGWLIIGLFVWIVIPGLNFADGLLVSACITATDPILAQSVVSGKFAERVPGHLRNLLSAESGCNDGMAFPFIFLALNLILHPGDGREIVKDWICVTLLYECIFGCILGVVIGYAGRISIRFATERNIVDRESFLAFYVVLTFMCAGFGSILGVDDLLVSFAAGTAFAWDGWFSEKTEESKVSTVIDLLLNYAYFIYFGAIIPWEQFNEGEIGTNVWRLIILSVVIIFLRRIPAVLVLKSLIPDIKSWREAVFVGHFGPIGVGAIFAAILARSELEASVSDEETPLRHLPPKGTKHWQLISCIWPMVCFFIVTSIIVHGSSVAIITLGRHLNTVTLTKSFTTHTTSGKNTWMQRLPSLDKTGRSFSLQRVDTDSSTINMSRHNTVETSGIPVKHAGGMTRKPVKHKKHRLRRRDIFGGKSKRETNEYFDEELNDLGRERLQREREARAGTFALGGTPRLVNDEADLESRDLGEFEDDRITQNSADYSHESKEFTDSPGEILQEPEAASSMQSNEESLSSWPQEEGEADSEAEEDPRLKKFENLSITSTQEARLRKVLEDEQRAEVAYIEGEKVIIENSKGEVLNEIDLNANKPNKDEEAGEDDLVSRLSRAASGQSSRSRHSLRVIPSPPEIIKRERSADNKGKYRAYKIDNQLIIENKDGEVLRRYRINPHERKMSSPIVPPKNVLNKTLTALGLRSRSASTAQSKAQPDASAATGPMKKMVRNLTPAPKNVEPPSEVSEESDDEEEEYDTSDGSTEDGVEQYHSKPRADMHETEIERQRRLNALGRLAAPRDEDDEEEPIIPIESQTASKSGLRN